MITLPIPLFGALVLSFLFLKRVAEERRLSPLAWLILLCAAQSLIIALAQHYRVPGLRMVQPVTATFIPPVAWLVLRATAIRPATRRDLVHALGPVSAALALLAAPNLLDLLIPALFVGYGAAILKRSIGGPNALPQLRLEGGDLPALVWGWIGLFLVLSAVSDALIFAARQLGWAWLQPLLISAFAAGNLLLIGTLSLTRALKGGPAEDREPPIEPSPARTTAETASVTAADAAAMRRLCHVMATDRPYLDPDLTLIKLARRTGVPAKQLSSAVNRTTGQNVSRFVNDARIAAAKERLGAGEGVTSAMLASGFNTRSNFNREFQRVTGEAPSDWAKRGAPAR